MQQLILVSTRMEIQPFIEKAGFQVELPLYKPVYLRDDLSLLISGVGSPATIFHLTSLLSKDSYDRVIQLGVAGSYNPDIEKGTLVEVGEDCFADLGIDDRGVFTSIFDAGLSDPDLEPFSKGVLVNPLQKATGLPMVKGITVNTASGSKELIDQRKSKYFPDIESMEGAAAFFVCLQNSIPIIQVRSISNLVEPRDREAWELDLAIQNLNNWLFDFVIRSNTN